MARAGVTLQALTRMYWPRGAGEGVAFMTTRSCMSRGRMRKSTVDGLTARRVGCRLRRNGSMQRGGVARHRWRRRRRPRKKSSLGVTCSRPSNVVVVSPTAATSGKQVSSLVTPYVTPVLPIDYHRFFSISIWQGTFPGIDKGKDGYSGKSLTLFFPYVTPYFSLYMPRFFSSISYPGTAPVKAYGPQNQLGLYNMIGNVWEWVGDYWTVDHPLAYGGDGGRGRGGGATPPLDPKGPRVGDARIKKGGSFLCHKSYCNRYRIAARAHSSADSATANLGFRCARSGGGGGSGGGAAGREHGEMPRAAPNDREL